MLRLRVAMPVDTDNLMLTCTMVGVSCHLSLAVDIKTVFGMQWFSGVCLFFS